MNEFSWKILWIYLFLTIIGVKAAFDSSWWSGADDQELDDERRDAEILKAVQDSMVEWEARKRHRSRQKRAEASICYHPLGCFESSGPFSYLDTLPSPPEEISTTFLLYPGRRSPRSITLGDSPLVEVPFSNITDAFSWASRHFNASKPTKVLVHGFGSSCHYVWVYEMRSALMAVDDFNIVCVDWENGAVLPNYVKAAANTRLVGKQLAMLLKGLEERVGLTRTTMHLIGFSLGAHVAGFAGSEMRNISRITGLDPAGPLFESQVPDARLDSSDATFVDVIHSNGENLFLGGLGSWQPMGHVDFYPNGGRMQKGCSNLFVGAVSDFIWSSDVEGRSLCNHRRAYKFFVDSVSPRCQFPAYPCESYDAFLEGKCFPCTNERHCGNMGYFADKAIGRGQLFLITRDEEPFCAHQYSVKIESSSMSKPLVNYGKIKITLVGDSDLNETFTMTSKDDEQLIPGDVLSRILVPHPIISEPTRVQISYHGYSGWLSSGFRKWKINKVSMMDSFGKTSSVCKKGLELESGVPIMLHLQPGDCQISPPLSDPNLLNSSGLYRPPGFERMPPIPARKFIPTPVIKIGDEAIHQKIPKEERDDIFQGNNNNVDQDQSIESTRSFNTKSFGRTSDQNDEQEIGDGLKEIAEPILRKSMNNKNARAHDLNKPEITEPILGPTTVRSVATTTPQNLLTRLLGEKEINYNFYDTENSNWNQQHDRDSKFKRHDDFGVTVERSGNGGKSDSASDNDTSNPLKMIMMTVQFLPQRLSKMFEQAERYARETILPLISQHTPKFISNFISPRGEKPQTTYVPLRPNEDSSGAGARRIPKNELHPPDVPVKLERTDEESFSDGINTTGHPPTNRRIAKTDFNPPDLPVSLGRTDEDSLQQMLNTSRSTFHADDDHSVKNFTSRMDVEEMSSEISSPNEARGITTKDQTFQEIPPNSKVFYDDENPTTPKIEKSPRKIYVDLPVFDERDIGIKYIPLVYPESLKPEKITKR